SRIAQRSPVSGSRKIARARSVVLVFSIPFPPLSSFHPGKQPAPGNSYSGRAFFAKKGAIAQKVAQTGKAQVIRRQKKKPSRIWPERLAISFFQDEDFFVWLSILSISSRSIWDTG